MSSSTPPGPEGNTNVISLQEHLERASIARHTAPEPDPDLKRQLEDTRADLGNVVKLNFGSRGRRKTNQVPRGIKKARPRLRAVNTPNTGRMGGVFTDSSEIITTVRGGGIVKEKVNGRKDGEVFADIAGQRRIAALAKTLGDKRPEESNDSTIVDQLLKLAGISDFKNDKLDSDHDALFHAVGKLLLKIWPRQRWRRTLNDERVVSVVRLLCDNAQKGKILAVLYNYDKTPVTSRSARKK